MADGVTVDNGSLTDIDVATDEVNINSQGVKHVGYVKLADGTNGGTDPIPGTTARGLSVDPRPKVVRLAVTPTVSTTPAYTAKDAVGGLMTFSNAVRASGGSGVVMAVQVEDKDQELKAMDLVLFDRSITAPTDNAVFDPTDAELANCVGVIPIGAYADFNDNAVAVANNVGLAFVANGTDLFGVLVARDTPTFTATSDIVVTLTIYQD